MTTICPKCRHLWQPDETAPSWQCPACGVAYAKAGDAGRGVVGGSGRSYRALEGNDSGTGWGGVLVKLVLLAAVLWGVWAGWQGWQRGTLNGVLSGAAVQGGSAGDKMSALAAGVGAGDVVMW